MGIEESVRESMRSAEKRKVRRLFESAREVGRGRVIAWARDKRDRESQRTREGERDAAGQLEGEAAWRERERERDGPKDAGGRERRWLKAKLPAKSRFKIKSIK